MKKEYEITVIADGDKKESIEQALAREGLHVKLIREIFCFEDWLEALPDHPVPGLAVAVAEWFRHWGIGGGDMSTEVCAMEVCTTDHPRELARAIYEEIGDYSKSDFDAKELVMVAIDGCLDELQSG